MSTDEWQWIAIYAIVLFLCVSALVKQIRAAGGKP